MARKADPNPRSKEQLLKAAQRLMLEKGFTATSVDEICEISHLSKGTFFHYFKDKDDLGKTVLEFYVKRWTTAFYAAPFRNAQDPLKRVFGHIDFLLDNFAEPRAPRSCLLGNLTQELSQTHSELRSLCREYFFRWSQIFKKDLDAAKAEYSPNRKIDTRSLAEYLVVVFEGALLFSKANGDKKALKESLGHYKAYLRSLYQS